MPDARRMVLDVLKPHDPPLLTFTAGVADTDTVEAVSGSLIELDKEVQNVKLTLEGSSLDYDTVEAAVEDLGGTVHSVDQVAYGDYIVEERPTPQD